MDPKGTFAFSVAGALVNVGFYLVDQGIKSLSGEAGKLGVVKMEIAFYLQHLWYSFSISVRR